MLAKMTSKEGAPNGALKSAEAVGAASAIASLDITSTVAASSESSPAESSE
jgi:hypothetical protein